MSVAAFIYYYYIIAHPLIVEPYLHPYINAAVQATSRCSEPAVIQHSARQEGLVTQGCLDPTCVTYVAGCMDMYLSDISWCIY